MTCVIFGQNAWDKAQSSTGARTPLRLHESRKLQLQPKFAHKKTVLDLVPELQNNQLNLLRSANDDCQNKHCDICHHMHKLEMERFWLGRNCGVVTETICFLEWWLQQFLLCREARQLAKQLGARQLVGLL
jgi:hypothetical protein